MENSLPVRRAWLKTMAGNIHVATTQLMKRLIKTALCLKRKQRTVL